MSAERFCDRCDVDLGLHPWPEDDIDRGCAAAEERACLVSAFFTAAGPHTEGEQ